jgi:hypothetical protein
MRLDREELDRRLQVADARRLALRRATRELQALGAQILGERAARRGGDDDDRPRRSDRGPAGG